MDANIGLLIAYPPMAVVNSDMVKGLLLEARGSTVQSGLGRLPRSPASSTATAALSKKDEEAARALAQSFIAASLTAATAVTAVTAVPVSVVPDIVPPISFPSASDVVGSGLPEVSSRTG